MLDFWLEKISKLRIPQKFEKLRYPSYGGMQDEYAIAPFLHLPDLREATFSHASVLAYKESLKPVSGPLLEDLTLYVTFGYIAHHGESITL